MLSEDKPDPGKLEYPDLQESFSADIDGKVTGYVLDGRVVFVRYDEDMGDHISISMSEWDFGNFVGEHLMRRVSQIVADRTYGEG